MQGINWIADSFCPSEDNLQQFPWVFMSDKEIWDPSNVTYHTILDMSQTMEKEADPVVSRSTPTFSISNESIETYMNMSNIHNIMVKTVNINQQ